MPFPLKCCFHNSCHPSHFNFFQSCSMNSLSFFLIKSMCLQFPSIQFFLLLFLSGFLLFNIFNGVLLSLILCFPLLVQSHQSCLFLFNLSTPVHSYSITSFSLHCHKLCILLTKPLPTLITTSPHQGLQSCPPLFNLYFTFNIFNSVLHFLFSVILSTPIPQCLLLFSLVLPCSILSSHLIPSIPLFNPGPLQYCKHALALSSLIHFCSSIQCHQSCPLFFNPASTIQYYPPIFQPIHFSVDNPVFSSSIFLILFTHTQSCPLLFNPFHPVHSYSSPSLNLFNIVHLY